MRKVLFVKKSIKSISINSLDKIPDASILVPENFKHDFLNAIVIINSLSKSATIFMKTISESMDFSDINQKQMEKFLYCMSAIGEQTAKIENYFLSVLNE